MTENKMPAWEVILRVINPDERSGKRPRRTSLHTLASHMGLTTHDEIKALAKEMQTSGKVLGYRCPDVRTLIFYPLDYAKNGVEVTDPNGVTAKLSGMIDTRDTGVWGRVDAILTEYPYPANRGFKRFSGGGSSGMSFSYEQQDYPLAKARQAALIKNGYEDHLTIPEPVICGCPEH